MEGKKEVECRVGGGKGENSSIKLKQPRTKGRMEEESLWEGVGRAKKVGNSHDMGRRFVETYRKGET